MDLKTGKIEISSMSVEVLSDAKELPLPVFGEQDYPEVELNGAPDLEGKRCTKYNFKIKSNFYKIWNA